MKKKQPKWKPIKMGERLPCQSFLRKKDGEILKLSTGAGIKVGQDAYYLPVDDVIEEIKNYPIEESEDEKIRKELLTFFRESIHGGHILTNKEYDSWIAWLEKQGDKDKLIKELGEYKVKYTQEVLQGEQKSNPCENCSIATNNCQNFPCTIRDCEQKPVDKVEPKFKVGDIITNGILIGEIDEIHEWGYHAYFGDHYADVPDVENWHKWTIQDAKANAGYEGNADKKELKEIEHNPAWSEEEEYLQAFIIELLYGIEDTNDKEYEKKCRKAADWLKSLRPQSTWKPSDEHYELEEFAKIVRGNLTGISKAVQKLFEAKYLQLTGNKMYGRFKD